jgi:hypothetical protein
VGEERCWMQSSSTHCSCHLLFKNPSIRTGKCQGAKGCTHHHNGNLTEHHEAAVLLQPKPVVSLCLRRTTVVAWSRLVDSWCVAKNTLKVQKRHYIVASWLSTYSNIPQIIKLDPFLPRSSALIFDIQVPDLVVWGHYCG